MATYYIDATGDDATGDGSSGSPWRNLWHAIDNSAVADTIIVNSGTNVQTKGLEVIQGVSFNERQILGETTSAECVLDFDNINCFAQDTPSGSECLIKDIKVINSRTFNSRNRFLSGFDGTIDDCIFENITVRGGPNAVQGVEGFIGLTSNGTIQNTLIKDIRMTPGRGGAYLGLRPSASGGTVNFRNCTFYESGEYDIATQALPSFFIFLRESNESAGDTGTLILKNCIFYAENPFVLYDELDKAGVLSDIQITNSVYFNSTIDDDSRLTVTNSITDDPLFIDPDNGIFEIEGDSPARGLGTLL